MLDAKNRRPRLRALVVAVPAAIAMLVAVGPGFAGAVTTPPTPPGTKDVIEMALVKGQLQFVGPPTVHAGDELEIVNKTKPSQVGPHTFSLVTKGSLPKTPKARQLCFTPKHICQAIAHGTASKAKGGVTKNPAEAGPGRLEHDGHARQEGRLLVHREQTEYLVRPESDRRRQCRTDGRSTSSARSIPGCRGRPRSCRRRASSTSGPPPPPPRLRRRAFLGALGGGALATLLPLQGRGALLPFGDEVAGGAGGGALPGAAADPAGPHRARLEIPIREAEVQILPGRRPGSGPTAAASPARPSAARRAADRVTFHHQLPAKAGELTVHLHGGHNRSRFDGQPGGLTSPPADLLFCRIPAASPRASRATTC